MTLQELLATSVATGIDLDESTRLAPLYEGRWDDCLRMLRLTNQCQTSYLVSQELSVQGDLSHFLVEWIRSRIAQQGLLTQLALLAYRLDHESYPETLDELTPDYIAWQPRDPYSRQPFVYFPKGLERPLLQSYNSGKLTPGTPVFWSVGVSQCVLKQQRVNQYGEGSYGYGDTGNETEGESDTFVELMYVLEPTWSYRDGWYSANSVFPLPVD